MECRRGLAMRILSVRLPNACIVTKRTKYLYIFYTVQKITQPSFFRRRMVGGLVRLPEILGQPAPVGAK